MSDVSAVLGLPYLLPSQAQKHVTHNEALRMLDVLVQLSVLDRSLTTPPADPQPGQRWIVGFGGTGPWAGRDGQIAAWLEDGWLFLTAQEGWRAQVLAEGRAHVFDGAVWVPEGGGPQEFPRVGISTGSDDTNRLAVVSPASLFSHAGAGHQLKVNKAAPVETATLLFQSGWSGRAEMGLAGTDDFSVKVSADGSAFVTALSADRASGAVTLPAGVRTGDGTAAAPAIGFAADADTGFARTADNRIGMVTGGIERAALSAAGLTVNVPITGTAVTQSQADATAGRLLKVGDFGWGTISIPRVPVSLDDVQMRNGLHVTFSGVGQETPGTYPPGMGVGFAASALLEVLALNGGSIFQRYTSNWNLTTWTRRYIGSSWSPWRQIGNPVGTVGQVGGVPTGAVIERGANGNGSFVRFADGTQLCWITFDDSAAAWDVPAGTLFRRGASINWTYPAAFVTPPAVLPAAHFGDDRITGARPRSLPGNSDVSILPWASAVAAVGTQKTVFAHALGRWF